MDFCDTQNEICCEANVQKGKPLRDQMPEESGTMGLSRVDFNQCERQCKKM
jgi:hypothetical protein